MAMKMARRRMRILTVKRLCRLSSKSTRSTISSNSNSNTLMAKACLQVE
jgi:hypothetical protein